MLVYGWGNVLNLVRVSESKSLQDVKNSKTSKVNKVEVGRIVILEAGKWTVGGDVLALQWLNVNVGSFTSAAFALCTLTHLCAHLPANYRAHARGVRDLRRSHV